MYRFELRLQFLSLVLLVVLVPHLLSDARPLNPSMEVEGRKKQSLSSSTFEAPVKEQYVANKGEIPAGGPPAMYSPPSHIGNHEMSSAGQRVHGGEYVSLKKGPVPPSAPNPITHGP
ncbi:hypothetical protein CMV_022838 [Castanea mollissima]|uniref:Uncharacterized protein n=1 Tax=Castanea mollissima TaxID=60419 RepID=A0A8J4VB87_9ROSI|nr:hypothetical protein CMV_022838 [Castanea mollissima]